MDQLTDADYQRAWDAALIGWQLLGKTAGPLYTVELLDHPEIAWQHRCTVLGLSLATLLTHNLHEVGFKVSMTKLHGA